MFLAVLFPHKKNETGTFGNFLRTFEFLNFLSCNTKNNLKFKKFKSSKVPEKFPKVPVSFFPTFFSEILNQKKSQNCSNFGFKSF